MALADSWPSIGSLHFVLTSTQLFLKDWVPLPELRRHWFTCTVTSARQMRPGSEPRPPTHGVNSRLGNRLTLTLGLAGMSGYTCIAPKVSETLSPDTTTTWGHIRQDADRTTFTRMIGLTDKSDKVAASISLIIIYVYYTS